MSGVNEIRSTFLNYFARHGHTPVESSSLVPHNDPTLMFTNAGMVQFKNVFTGMEKRPYSRATTSQKCVRAGGKHNDLDNVGYTARHHTFFEMLGNFSFGDYFKEDAIAFAWELITKDFGLPASRLLVTVYADDEEAFGLWKKIAGLSDSKIIRIASSDNFWAMGDTGPCGPCSEIFFDHGDHIAGGPPGSADQDGDRFIEIWNLVFMQYEQITPQERIALPKPSIDTGMGLERIAAVLQGTHDNYETDLMRALLRQVGEALSTDPDGTQKASHRVIADHLRAASFLVADGVLPSNEGRGYVLRRIMRRAMRHAQLLGARDPLMHKLVPALTREMGVAYPELTRAQRLIEDTLKLEETRFRTTLTRGLGILENETQNLKTGDALSGDVAFTLYDTYGFPLDLTQDALRPRGISVDTTAFNAAMENQRQMARASWSGSGESATEAVWYGVRERVGATEFLGYHTEKAAATIVALIKEGVEVSSLKAGESGVAVLNQTPFYAESGGQVGDAGVFLAPDASVTVSETHKKLGDVFAHSVRLETGVLTLGMSVDAIVDCVRRTSIRANHSATHLLHEALRGVLGDHIAQKGSLVSADRLRFDFSHPTPILDTDIAKIEDIANRYVLQNEPVITKVMDVESAKESGARALFGEKYGDEVRVVSMGVDDAQKAFSVELCGGTHVRQTGDIGLIAIVNEGAVASGVRRLEALTGDAARHHLRAMSRQLEHVAGQLKTSVADVTIRLESVMAERRKLERDLADQRRKMAMGGAQGADDAIQEIGGIAFLGKIVQGLEMKDVKGLADQLKAKLGSGIVAVVSVAEDGKAALVVGVSADLTSRFDAVALVREGSLALGGKGGGGRPDFAQAGGPEGAKAEGCLAAIGQMIKGS
jgi:alanyl-tRNA synthetase